MPVLVKMMAVLIALLGAVCVVQGFIGGGWVWGLITGGFSAAALAEWASLRSSNDARHAADRMLVLLAIAMIQVARPALDYLEDLFRAGL